MKVPLDYGLGDATPQLRRGRVWCHACGATLRVDSAQCLRRGWPSCCGSTMSIDSPQERARQDIDLRLRALALEAGESGETGTGALRDLVLEVVAREFNLAPVFIWPGRARLQPLALARQVCMALVLDLGGLSLPQAGQLFDRHHSTVLHARDLVRDLPEHETNMVKLSAEIAALRAEVTP